MVRAMGVAIMSRGRSAIQRAVRSRQEARNVVQLTLYEAAGGSGQAGQDQRGATSSTGKRRGAGPRGVEVPPAVWEREDVPVPSSLSAVWLVGCIVREPQTSDQELQTMGVCVCVCDEVRVQLQRGATQRWCRGVAEHG